MATEILRPRDLLSESLHAPTTSFHRRRFSPATAKLSVSRRHQRRASPKPDAKKRTIAAAPEDGGLVMGKVTILKRGEPLSFLAKNPVRKQPAGFIATPQMAEAPPRDWYAGGANYASPSPRALPRPSFLKAASAPFADGATRDLRRMLRLE